jgi:MYXO-CTERM domain-containing protein
VSGSSSCSSSRGGSGGALLGLLAAVGVGWRRRRRAAAVATMAAVTTAGAGVAAAEGEFDQRDFSVERYRWTSDAAGVLGAEAGTVDAQGSLFVGAALGAQNEPLVVYNLTTQQRIGSLVERRLGGELHASYVPLPRLQVALAAPVIFSQTGQDALMGVAEPLDALDGAGFGDLSAAVKVAVLRDGGARPRRPARRHLPDRRRRRLPR